MVDRTFAPAVRIHSLTRLDAMSHDHPSSRQQGHQVRRDSGALPYSIAPDLEYSQNPSGRWVRAHVFSFPRFSVGVTTGSARLSFKIGIRNRRNERPLVNLSVPLADSLKMLIKRAGSCAAWRSACAPSSCGARRCRRSPRTERRPSRGAPASCTPSAQSVK